MGARSTRSCESCLSQDGMSWVKPDTRQVALKEAHHIGGGDEGGNVLRLGCYGLGVIKDAQDPNASRRYKAFGMIRQPAYSDADMQRVSREAVGGALVSADGVRWAEEYEADFRSQWGAYHSLFWDDPSGRYIATVRRSSHQGSAVSMSASEPDAFRGFEEPVVVATPPNGTDLLQSAQAFPYYGVYLAVLLVVDAACAKRRKQKDTAVVRGCDGRTRCELAWSANLRAWRRLAPPDRQTLEEPSDFGRLPVARGRAALVPLIAGSFHSHGCFAAKPVDVPGARCCIKGGPMHTHPPGGVR